MDVNRGKYTEYGARSNEDIGYSQRMGRMWLNSLLVMECLRNQPALSDRVYFSSFFLFFFFAI